jgi:hypothetical protein
LENHCFCGGAGKINELWLGDFPAMFDSLLGCHHSLEFFFPIVWDQLQEYGDIIMIDDLVMVID